jgi:hypothetical protein
VDGWGDIIQVAADGYHTVGLKSDGTAVAVGYNIFGQCEVDGWGDIIQVAAGGYHTVGLKSDGTAVAVGYNIFGQCEVDGWWLPTCYEEGYQAGMESCADTIAQLQAEIDELNNLLAAYCDTTPPAGSVHAYPNLIWPPNNKMVEVTLSGYVCDELSIARDGGGIGVSSAYLLVNGEETIPLVIDDGSFSVTKEFEARAGALYTVELYAADTKPVEDGGPNSGLIDQTYIRVPLNVGNKGG